MTMTALPPPAPAAATVTVQARLVQLEMPRSATPIILGLATLQATDAWLTVDVFRNRSTLSRGPATQRVVELPIGRVTGVDIEGQPDRARGFSTANALAFGVVGGLVGSGRRVQGVTRFVVSTDVGWMLFETGLPAPALRAALAPLLERL